MQNTIKSSLAFVALVATSAACMESEPAHDGAGDMFLTGDGKADGAIAEGTPDARAVLRVANGATAATLDDAVGLYAPAVKNLVGYRAGADGALGTADDRVIRTLAELDAIPYIGPVSYQQLIDYGTSLAWQDWVPATFATVTVPVPVIHKTWSSLSQSDPNPGEPGTAKTLQLKLTVEAGAGFVTIVDLERTTRVYLDGDGSFDMSFRKSGISDNQRNVYEKRRTMIGRIDARGEIVITQYSESSYYGNSIYGYTGHTTTLAGAAFAGLPFVN